MPTLYLGLILSGQDGNVVAPRPAGGPANEMQQMAILADDYEEELKTTFANFDIVYKRFNPRPQSQDTYSYQSLHTVQKEAYDWFAATPSGGNYLALNLHSDAGRTSSWVAYCYDTQSTHSKAVGLAICQRLSPVFDGAQIIPVDYTTYIMATDQRHHNNPTLIEHGNHQNLHDNTVLHTKGREVARAALQAIVTYYGMKENIVDPFDGLPQKLIDAIKARPDLGVPRRGNGLTYTDPVGDVVAKLTSGAVGFYRKYTDTAEVIDWKPVAPVYICPNKADVEKAVADLAATLSLLKVSHGL